MVKDCGRKMLVISLSIIFIQLTKLNLNKNIVLYDSFILDIFPLVGGDVIGKKLCRMREIILFNFTMICVDNKNDCLIGNVILYYYLRKGCNVMQKKLRRLC